MKEIIETKEIENKILIIRGEKILIDRDVADLYGVETKRINEVVKNNLDKFPKNYMFKLNKDEFENLRSFETTSKFNKTRVLPKAFTEKGIYMLATLLRSKKATEVTFQIIETFSKLKELTNSLSEISKTKDKETKETLMRKSGQIFNEILESSLECKSETTIELNLAVLKLSHKIKK